MWPLWLGRLNQLGAGKKGAILNPINQSSCSKFYTGGFRYAKCVSYQDTNGMFQSQNSL